MIHEMFRKVPSGGRPKPPPAPPIPNKTINIQFKPTKFYKTIEERNKFTLDIIKDRLQYPERYDPYYADEDNGEQFWRNLVEECIEFIEELIKK